MVEISFIIPVHNVEDYIDKCVQSILSQNNDKYEILLIDDRSTDNSYEKCRYYSDKYNNVKTLRTHEPYGVSVARNIGINEASGKWISFIDSDDWIGENFVELFLSVPEICSYDIIVSDYICHLPKSEEKCSFLNLSEGKIARNDMIKVKQDMIVPNEISSNAVYTHIGVPWAKIYSTKYIRENNIEFPVGLKKMQDCIFNLYAFEKTDSVYYIKKNLYYYRKNSGSVCNRYNGFDFNTSSHLLREIKSFIDIYYENDFEWMKCFYKKSFDCYLETINLLYAHIETTYTGKESVDELYLHRYKEPYNKITDYVCCRDIPVKKKLSFVLFKVGTRFSTIILYKLHMLVSRVRYIKLWGKIGDK